jgi:hypothetical protein
MHILYDLIIRLGVWVAKKLAKAGLHGLALAVRSDIKRLKRKIQRLRKKGARAVSLRQQTRAIRRIKFNVWRIGNRKRLLTWISERTKALTQAVADQVLQKAKQLDIKGERMADQWAEEQGFTVSA